MLETRVFACVMQTENLEQPCGECWRHSSLKTPWFSTPDDNPGRCCGRRGAVVTINDRTIVPSFQNRNIFFDADHFFLRGRSSWPPAVPYRRLLFHTFSTACASSFRRAERIPERQGFVLTSPPRLTNLRKRPGTPALLSFTGEMSGPLALTSSNRGGIGRADIYTPG